MTHNEREGVLNSIGGNTFSYYHDNEEEEFLCEWCSTIVKRRQWDPIMKCCVSCLEMEE